MIAITGGAGFIGSALARELNHQGRSDLLLVDDLSQGEKIANINRLQLSDYWDREELLQRLQRNEEMAIEVFFHQGACVDTSVRDGRLMMAQNYRYTRLLLEYCLARRIPLIYASSAAVYSNKIAQQQRPFRECAEDEEAANPYGFSKWLLDCHLRRLQASSPLASQVVGLRYFNVYGPGEQHKGRMASVAYQFYRQAHADGCLRLFCGSDGYGDGEQRRDFVFVDDVVAVNLWFWQHPEHGGIFNLGTGRSRSFNALARAFQNHFKQPTSQQYIAMPEDLRAHYQSYTEADLRALRAVGYERDFIALEDGIGRYLSWLQER